MSVWKSWVVVIAACFPLGCGLPVGSADLQIGAGSDPKPSGQGTRTGVSNADGGALDAGAVTAAPPGPDAGTTPDAGTKPDAGTRPDAGTKPDAGSGTFDAGPPILPGDAGTADVRLTIDSAAAVHPISRYIYGENLNGTAWSAVPHLTLGRLGGNRWTAYNWENNASNAGSDYLFHNDAYLGGGTLAGGAVKGPVGDAQAASAAMIVTVPICGLVAADTLGTDVTGQALTSRFRQDVASKGAPFAYPPNLTDANVYQDEFVSWLEAQFPNAHTDPAREIFYSLDNEPDLWSDTHSEIHPVPVTYAELLSKSISYASAVKAVAPGSRIFGSVNYGWSGFVDLQGATDAAGRDYIEFFLDGMKTAGTTAGKRLLDVLDLHWYPEATGGGTRITGEDTSAAVAAARVQAPRSLWDPGYVETSWITSSLGNQPIKLLPLMKAKVAAKYPGTGLAFTEYYYGGGAHISGAVAQADVLGIFGRDEVFAATLWPMSSNLTFIHGGFAMFRSYDGAAGAFGDTSVQATTSDVPNSSVYASVDAGASKRLVLVVINKATTAKVAALSVSHPVAFDHAQVYQLTAAGSSPVRAADLAPTGTNAFRYTMPAMSVSTLVLLAP